MKAIVPLLIALSLGFAQARAGGPVFSNPLVIDNSFAPFVAGAVKVYVGKSDGENVVVADLFLEETRTFDLNGTDVECAILQETEFEGGQLTEISTNYFAQSDDGVVFYFGETVDAYEDGVITGHGGSWLVGGATLPSDPEDTANADAPAVFMPADPQIDDTWKPEDLLPFVDETDTLLDDDAKVKVPAGKFEGCLKVEESSSLDSGTELKWYAPGVGVIRAKAKGESLKLVASTMLPAEGG